MSTPLFERTVHIAMQIPNQHKADALIAISSALARRPGTERASLFDRVLQAASDPRVARREEVLAMLGNYLPALPLGERQDRYDALLRAIRTLPQACRATPAATLFAAIQDLPPYEQRHLPFIEAIDFIAMHPVAMRHPMLMALQDSIWCQTEDVTQLQCLDSHLSLIGPLPPDQAGDCLRALYRADLDDQTDSFKFYVSSKLFEAAANRPDLDQIGLLGDAARLALKIDQPYCGPMFGRITQWLERLPAPLPADASMAVAAPFAQVIAAFDFDEFDPPALPDYFCAVLDAATRLPDDLRLGVLLGMKQSLARCPETLRPEAAKVVADCVNSLPVGLLTRWTTLQAA